MARSQRILESLRVCLEHEHLLRYSADGRDVLLVDEVVDSLGSRYSMELGCLAQEVGGIGVVRNVGRVGNGPLITFCPAVGWWTARLCGSISFHLSVTSAAALLELGQCQRVSIPAECI